MARLLLASRGIPDLAVIAGAPAAQPGHLLVSDVESQVDRARNRSSATAVPMASW
jgi:hypothetical protein